MFRERPFGQLIEHKQTPQPFRLHDKTARYCCPGAAVLKSGISFPRPLLPVPLDQHPASGIPRLAVNIHRRPVVQHASVPAATPGPASVLPSPDGSALSRLAIWLPTPSSYRRRSTGQAVVPSSRNSAKLLNNWPFFMPRTPLLS